MQTLDDRKLTAILSIDVVGYSAAVEQDEAEAVSGVEALRARIEALAASGQGRVFNTAGDAFMCAFELPSAAMAMATALLDEAASPGAGIPSVRMGMHIGEVLASGSDLLGHGVNIAARLMSLAAPNSVLVSDAVRTALRGKSSAIFVPYGQVRLAKMHEVVTAYGYAPEALGQRLRNRYLARRILRRWPWAGATLAIAAAVMAPMALREEQRQQHYEVASVEMLTDEARSEGWPALSPDGRYMVYVAEDTTINAGNLVLRTMADGAELQLTDTPEFEIAPAFSPDGDQLAFARLTNPNRPGRQLPCELFVRAFPLGVDRRVGTCEVSQFIERVSWTRDGGLIYSEPPPNGGPARIFRVDVVTGERRVLVPPPAEGGGDYDASVSPDGSRIVFLRHAAPPASDVFVYELASGTLTQITSDHAFAHVAWAPDSRRVFIAYNAGGRREVVVRRADGAGEGERIFIGWRSILRLTAARDLIAFHSIADPRAVFRIGPTGAARITSGAADDGAPDVSSRGALAFLRYGTERGLYVQPADASPRRLLDFDELTYPRALRWSPDGRRIAFSSTVDVRSRLHIVDVASGRVRELPTPPELSAENPNWSLDGASVTFAGLDEGEVRIYRIAADGQSAPEAISGPGWVEAVETAQGFIGARLGEPGVWRLPSGAEAPVSITRLAPAVCVCPTAVAVLSGSHWRVVGDHLYLLVTQPVGGERIVVMDLTTGRVLRNYPVAAQGDPSFAHLAIDPAKGDIYYARSAREHYSWEVGLMRLRTTTR